jgi:hypothetical protein
MACDLIVAFDDFAKLFFGVFEVFNEGYFVSGFGGREIVVLWKIRRKIVKIKILPINLE